MATSVKKKLNRAGTSHSGRIIRIIDKDFFGGLRLTATQRIVFNALYSFTQKGNVADFTYGELEKRYHISYASARRAIHAALLQCYKLGAEAHTYTPGAPFAVPKHYFYIYDWLRHAEFPSNEIQAPLSYNEIDTLSYILHQQRHFPEWSSSQAQIARDLDIAPSTVGNALNGLEAKNILTRSCSAAVRNRAANHHEKCFYAVNRDYLKTVKAATVQRAKGLPGAVKDADARTDRDRFYDERTKRAYARKEEVEAELRKTALGREVLELKAALEELEKTARDAQRRHRADLVLRIMTKRNATKRAMLDKLTALGFTATDLEPRFLCPECRDTGWRIADGKACNCFIPPTGGNV